MNNRKRYLLRFFSYCKLDNNYRKPANVHIGIFSTRFSSDTHVVHRTRGYLTAGINRQNFGKQLIILLLTISRPPFVSLLCSRLAASFRCKIESDPSPGSPFYRVFRCTRWDFADSASDRLFDCERNEINVTSFA